MPGSATRKQQRNPYCPMRDPSVNRKGLLEPVDERVGFKRRIESVQFSAHAKPRKTESLSCFKWMLQMGKSNSLPPAGHYDANYGNFQTELYAQIRHEAFGEDIGQNSWLTSAEQDRFLEWLDPSPGKALLDVACGAGGPALRIA